MRQPEYDSLTSRQSEIAELLVRGMSTREIALELTLSPRTVETHVAAIYNKYGVSSRAELMLAVLGPGAEAAAGATLPVADAVKTNLPVRRAGLVGRATDIETVAGMLRASQLVTLTGAGGVGKTQAALAVGESLLGDFPGGVWLVELAALGRGSPVGEALARALSIEPAKDLSLIDSLVAHLQRKTTLVIIDNCEHVIAQAARLADALLRRCPRLQILATSREPLRIAGEQTYRLPSLPVPTLQDAARLRAGQATDYAAVELFTVRAQAVDFSFALDDENTPLVARMCRRLDGIPLAIELAAARVKVLSLGALATKIESHLRILAGGDRLALPRHRTMHALIDWSYHLLAPAEQRLFDCMSVVSGGCALEQAAAVYGAEADDDLAILDLLASLVDKSLLVVDRQSDEPRYSMLQSFAHYASEKLEARGESTIVRERHAGAYTVVAERLEEEYELAPTAAWYARAVIEFENLTSALDWTLAGRRDVVLGQRLAAAMRPVWTNVRGEWRWLRIARDLTDESTPPLLAARLDDAEAWHGFTAGEFKTALATSRRLITVYRELGDPRAAYAQSLSATLLLCVGRLDEAEPLLAPALEAARSHGRAPLIAFTLRAGSHLCAVRGDLSGSRSKLAEALAIYERIGADRLATSMFISLAELEFKAGNVERAFELATKSLNLQRGYGWRHIAQGLANIAAYGVALNRWDRARAHAREALGVAQEVQDAMSLMAAAQHLAAVAVLSANDDGSSSASAPVGVSSSVSAMMAISASSSSTLARAALLLGYADACAVELGVVREYEYTEQQEYDRVLAALRASVPAADLAQYLAQGARWSRCEAVFEREER